MTTRVFALPAGQVTAPVRDGVWDARGVRYGSLDRATGPHTVCVAPEVAQSEPSVFPQAPGLLDALLGPALGELPQSPDSFTLRIQGPADVGPGDALPVLFFVPGGGFTTGGGEVRWYDAAELVRQGRFLLVTVNYRLGAAAGLLPDAAGVRSPGGLAWQDLLVAARWLREHVAAFGGDPDDVSVAGDSAGAWFAHALSTSETTRGWFARTLLVSMPRMAPLSEADDEARRASLAAALEAADESSCDAVLAAQRQVSSTYSGQGFPFAPARDAEMPAWLGDPSESGARLHTSELLLVTTRTEASAFLRHLPESTFTPAWVDDFLAAHFADATQVRDALAGRTGYEAAVALLTWWQFESVAHELADSATAGTRTKTGASVRVVRLDLPSPLPRALVPHCFPLPFLFGERTAWHDAPMLAGIRDDTFERTRQSLRAALLGLVHGDSSPAPVWEPAEPQFLCVLDDAGPQDVRRLQVKQP